MSALADRSPRRLAAVPAAPDGDPAPGYLQLPVDAIRPNPSHPRREFDDRALDELAESIRTWGQLQPVIVRHDRLNGGYELVCGERRWRAHRRAGLPTIWAIEREASDAESLRLALVENIQRVGLSPTEKLAALDQLAEFVQLLGLRRTATQFHIDPGWLSRLLAIRRDPLIYPALEAGQLSFGQAAELLRAPKKALHSMLDRLRAQPGVASAHVRAWVEEARALERPSRAVNSPSPQNPYRAILADLERLGRPDSAEQRAALYEVLRCVQSLLRPEVVGSPASTGQKRWVELNCLLCGERAGTVENGTLHVRPGSTVRHRDGRVVCGRCGGSLTFGERGVSYTYDMKTAARA
jgi:ParB family transcriptional regulator, chromosome partitioning protein